MSASNSTKFIVNCEGKNDRLHAIATFDNYDEAIKCVSDALGNTISDWDIIHTNNHIDGDGGKVCLFFHRRRKSYRIMITENSHNTLKDDPHGICQEHIREWMRL